MRITREMFTKLPVKKQIEYEKARKEIIDEVPVLGITFKIVYYLAILMGFFLIILPLWKMAFGQEVFFSLLLGITNIARLFPSIIILGVVCDFLVLIVYAIKLDRLKRKYFDIQIKVRKN